MGWVRLAFSLWQGLVMLKQTSERREKYDAARAQADATGKPLLVVGGPYGDSPFRRALDMPAHGPGDVTLDLSSRAIEGIPGGIVGDVRDIPFPDGHFGAVLISHVLEHLPTVDDCEIAVQELHRVADQVYVAGPGKDSALAHVIADHHLWVEEEDGVLYAQERTLWNRAAGTNPRDWS